MLKLLEAAGFFLYLILLLYMGSYISRNKLGNKSHTVFGYLAFILAMADSVYFIPRLYSLLTDGLEENLRILGWGRIGQMLIMTLFFLVLSDLSKTRFSTKRKLPMDKLLYGLMIFRAVIGLFPQNQWFFLEPDVTFAFLRFIPLVIYVLLLAMTLMAHSMKKGDSNIIVFSMLMILQLLLVEYPIWGAEKLWIIYVMAAGRGLLFLSMILIGYMEVRKQNELSRY